MIRCHNYVAPILGRFHDYVFWISCRWLCILDITQIEWLGSFYITHIQQLRSFDIMQIWRKCVKNLPQTSDASVVNMYYPKIAQKETCTWKITLVISMVTKRFHKFPQWCSHTGLRIKGVVAYDFSQLGILSYYAVRFAGEKQCSTSWTNRIFHLLNAWTFTHFQSI